LHAKVQKDIIFTSLCSYHKMHLNFLPPARDIRQFMRPAVVNGSQFLLHFRQLRWECSVRIGAWGGLWSGWRSQVFALTTEPPWKWRSNWPVRLQMFSKQSWRSIETRNPCSFWSSSLLQKMSTMQVGC